MPKDLREIVKKEMAGSNKLSVNHRSKFEAKLKTEMHAKKNRNFHLLKYAASFLVLVGLGTTMFYFSNNEIKTPVKTNKIESLGSISPELKKIENYYLATINTEISDLEVTKENKELLDSYFEKLGELSADYKELTNELNVEGLSENTINALIDNLQLRLKLLYQLKEQLNELKKLNLEKNESIQL